jgi:hypothetical protein
MISSENYSNCHFRLFFGCWLFRNFTRTCPIIRRGKDLAFGADADAAFGRWPALMGTTDAGTKMVGWLLLLLLYKQKREREKNG